MYRRVLFAALLSALPFATQAQTPFKIGVLAPMTGPFQSTGRSIENGVKLYIKQHGDVVAGRKIEILLRDDAGVPDNTKRLATELVLRDHVDAFLGFGLTPLALATSPVATQAKIPMLVTVAATSMITTTSPFIVRPAQVVTQTATTAANWALKNGIKKVAIVVSDYGPGYDAQKWFGDRFTAGGGTVVEALRVPLANPDFAPFLQKVKDAAPDAMFTFVPAGVGGIFAKQFVERGMDKTGMKFIATGDVMDDDNLNDMGDAVLGIVTAGTYSAAHPSALNKAFLAGYKEISGGRRASFVAAYNYDAMELLYRALTKTKGAGDGAALVEAMKGETFESPRGMITIDPETRDVITPVFMRRVEKMDGQLYNVEFETFAAVKDPAKIKP